MKRKPVQRDERRRALVEFNLISDSGVRSSIKRRGRGCLAFLTPGLLVSGALAAHALGLL